MHTILVAALGVSVVAALASTGACLRGQLAARVAALSCLRAAALCALAWALIGPTTESNEDAPVRLGIGFVLDGSRSMSLPEGARANRLEATMQAAEKLQGAARAADGQARVQWFSAGESAQEVAGPREVRAAERRTDLAGCVRDLVASSAVASAALFSDGDDTEGARVGPIARLARTGQVILAGIPVGAAAVARDIAVDRLIAPRRVREHSEFELKATIRAPGYEGEALTTELSRDGAPLQRISLAIGKTVRTVTARVRAAAPGRYRYALKVPPRAHELSAANNSRSVLVEVVPDKPAVLVIAGEPSVEYAFLKRFLLSDASLEPRLYVRKSPQGFWLDGEPPAPAELPSPDAGRTRAVILMDAPPQLAAGLAGKLTRFVREGGGLAVLGGASGLGGPGLAGVLPVQPGGAEFVDEGIRPQLASGADRLTGALRAAAIPFGGLPSWRGRNVVTGVKGGASAALLSGGAPVLASWEVGKGRTLVLATDGTHRWVFSPDAGERERRALDGFWGALLDWLCETRDDRPVTAEFDRDTYSQDMPARLVVQVREPDARPVTGAVVVAEVRTPRGQPQRLICSPSPTEAGRYETALATENVGSLRVGVTATAQGKRLGTCEAEVNVVEALAELGTGEPHPELLTALGRAAGGGTASARAPESLAAGLTLPASSQQRMVWRCPARGWWMLLALVVLWSLDWSLRRRWLGR